jgi:eukaryotic-like serine/threonine-protein kinase
LTHMDSPPRVLSGRYELVHLVARGGMAEVYRAHDRLLDRPVALKVLFSELSVDRTFVERFRREAQAAANLSHPNIVPVFDWGEDGGTYFIVMEFIDGRPLSAILRTAGPLHPDRAAEVAGDVALALDYAHRHGVIHRDVKPGNVLITDEGQVKVTDFGIARALNTDESLTQTGAVMGTATYFSPEQAEGLGVDARSDIYSLGVVLYEMVAGRPPFIGDSPVSVASKHVREQAPAPRQFNPSIPPDLEAIILKCMAKSPEYRYASGAELQVDLMRFKEGREVGAGPIPTGLLSGSTGTQAIPQIQNGDSGDDDEPTRTGLYITVLVVLLVALAVVAAFLGNTLGWWHFGDSTSTFSLPSVTGMQSAAAKSELETKGLVVTIDTVASDKSARGIVLSTKPGAHTQVRNGQNVVLDVGSGTPSPEVVIVPPVAGFTLHDATDELSGDGLKVISIPATCAQANQVVCSQTPSAGTQVNKGTQITLYYSNILTSTTVAFHYVPNVSGQAVQTACVTIKAADLVCAPSNQYQYQYSSTVADGVVISSLPPVGTPEASGSSVNLVISQGKQPVEIPAVTGLTVAKATSQLSGAGFNPVQQNDTKDKNPADCGIVTKQNPAGNQTAQPGTTVTITVGDGPNCNSSPTTTPTT